MLVELRPGEALLYVDEVTTPGRLVVATLDPWSHFGSHFMPATERFLDAYVDPDGRVVRRDQGGDTVSEGQAYALLLATAVGDEATVDLSLIHI